MPTFSIIIPVYNVARYLEDCLNSVIQQTFSDWEAICINDGSTDGSLSQLEKIAEQDNRFIIINQYNQGQAAARNNGLDIASGEYILFLDSDDYLHPDCLKIISQEIGDKDMLCFNGQLYLENENRHLPADTLEEADDISGYTYYCQHYFDKRHFSIVCVVLQCYRRLFIEQNNIRFYPGIYHEDNLFTPVAFYHAHHIKVINKSLYHYRIREGSTMTNKTTKHVYDMLIVANQLADFFTQLAGINKTIIYRAITHHYQVVFAQSNSKLDKELRSLVNWKLYKTVSRTKLRHRIHYWLIKMCPKMYRMYVESPKQSI